MSNPFDYVKAINSKTEMNDFSGYVPFIVNRALSYFADCIFYVNEMNMYPSVPVEQQFSFYINSLTKAKRFSKWAKPENKEDIEAVCTYYNYSMEKAKEALKVLSKKQLELIKEKIKGIQNVK